MYTLREPKCFQARRFAQAMALVLVKRSNDAWEYFGHAQLIGIIQKKGYLPASISALDYFALQEARPTRLDLKAGRATKACMKSIRAS